MKLSIVIWRIKLMFNRGQLFKKNPVFSFYKHIIYIGDFFLTTIVRNIIFINTHLLPL